jgi:hypothetical protein
MRRLPARPGHRPLGIPEATGLSAACLLCWKLRRSRWPWLAAVAWVAIGLAGIGSLTGCIGNGGLAMAPGSYYGIVVAQTQAPAMGVSTTFVVTVHE